MSKGKFSLAAALLGLNLAAGHPAAAHVFEERYDLPIPLWLNLAAGGVVVAVSFLAAALFLRPAPTGREVLRITLCSAGKSCGHFSTIARALIRLCSVLVFILMCVAGWFGSPEPVSNITPVLFWVVGWVGLAYVCALLGNVWVLINPWDILFQWTETAWRWFRPGRGLARELPYPPWLGTWPATVVLLATVWFLLGSGIAETPRLLAVLMFLYFLFTWAGMFLFGRETWLARGEAFAVLAGVLGRFAVTAWDTSSGTKAPSFFLRPPGVGLICTRPVAPSLVVFVVAVLAMASFEGLLDTPIWADAMTALGRIETEAGIHAPWMTGVALVGFTLLLYGIFFLVCALIRLAAGAAVPTGRDTRIPAIPEIAGFFVLSLAPIAIAYHIAHYLHWFMVSIQLVIPLVSDPLGFGWDLLGTRGYKPDIAIVEMKTIWFTAVAAIVSGHMVAMVVAHRIALNVFGNRRIALWSQVPMTFLMVGYSISSLWILAQPVVA